MPDKSGCKSTGFVRRFFNFDTWELTVFVKCSAANSPLNQCTALDYGQKSDFRDMPVKPSSGLRAKVQFLRYARKNHPPGCGSIPFRPSDAFADHPVDAQTDHSRYGNMSAIFKTCGACHSSAFVQINACTPCHHGLK